MRQYRLDLHIHTALSPCAERNMTPRQIVAAALKAGLDMIGICDHNSARNTAAVQEAGRGGLSVIAGMEIATTEEVHLLGLFPDAHAAEDVSSVVREGLPRTSAKDVARFGEEWLLDASDKVVAHEDRLLATASALPLREAVRLIQDHGGLAIPAHIARPSFGLLHQLGVFPENVKFDAVEIHPTDGPVPARPNVETHGYAVLAGSDSHSLEEIGSVWTMARMNAPGFEELALAVQGAGGRKVLHA